MKHMDELKNMLKARLMNRKGVGMNFNVIVELAVLVIVVAIMLLVLGSIFYLLWNPTGGTGLTIRGTIFNFFNDTNFLAIFPGLDAAFLLLLDFTPAIIGLTFLLGFLGLIAFVGITIANMAKAAARRR